MPVFPFDSAADPRISDRKVSGLNNRIDVEELAASWLMNERPESAAQVQEEGGS